MIAKRDVLVVDDDAVVHFISLKVLSTYKCVDKVYCAFNGSEALKILNDGCEGILHLPEVVIMDMHMPVMDGFQLINEIRRMECLRNRKIVTIMVSSTLDQKEIEKAIHLGIDYFMSKPIMIEKLEPIFIKAFV